MATTTPFPFGNYVHGDNAVARQLIAEYESALGDSDKAGEPDTAAYHEGRTEAFADALTMLLDVPGEAWEQYRSGVSPANPLDQPTTVETWLTWVAGIAQSEAGQTEQACLDEGEPLTARWLIADLATILERIRIGDIEQVRYP